MTTEHTKDALTAIWLLAIGFLGYAAGAASIVSWGALVFVAAAPPLVVRHFWRVPSQSTSESIRNALR